MKDQPYQSWPVGQRWCRFTNAPTNFGAPTFGAQKTSNFWPLFRDFCTRNCIYPEQNVTSTNKMLMSVCIVSLKSLFSFCDLWPRNILLLTFSLLLHYWIWFHYIIFTSFSFKYCLFLPSCVFYAIIWSYQSVDWFKIYIILLPYPPILLYYFCTASSDTYVVQVGFCINILTFNMYVNVTTQVKR